MLKNDMKYFILIFMIVCVMGCAPVFADDDTMNSIMGMVVQSLGGGGETTEANTEEDQKLAYYTDPRSQGYFEQVWGGACHRCGQVFPLSRAEICENKYAFCPNCHAVNNPAQANEYYTSRQGGQQNTSQYSYGSRQRQSGMKWKL